MTAKLFQIVDTTTGKVVPNSFFPDKMLAKKARRELNESANSPVRYIVSPGPDHRKYRK
jgi:hypothetical protein